MDNPLTLHHFAILLNNGDLESVYAEWYDYQDGEIVFRSQMNNTFITVRIFKVDDVEFVVRQQEFTEEQVLEQING